MQSIAHIRKDYSLKSLEESQAPQNPIEQFDIWWQEALLSSIDEVNAMTLCTADAEGHPHARIVLLKGFSETGFIFFTNYNSHKGQELAQNGFAALVFYWKELERQVRIEGNVETLAASESDAYFNSRPLGSRIGAIASNQSSIIPNRQVLEQKVQELTLAYASGNITRPAHWGGYLVKPQMMEFWQGRSSRLHDRLRYRLIDGAWQRDRLSP
jgi:pyridoxamine 5'-phosphate oxidase